MQRILGQSAVIEVLQASLRSGRVHHAWIFAGPRGVGKCTTAIEFARVLLDPDARPTLSGQVEADPESRTSRMIEAGTHPDLHIIRKELALYSDNRELRDKKLMNIPLDLIRERMLGGKTGDGRQHEAPAYRTSALDHGKVFIIDEAELLDQYAQNAILKTLEEPPAETYIILVTSRPERLLPTIRSRCQFVRFVPLDDAAMRQWFDQAGLDLDTKERAWIETFVGGSPGLAQLAADYGFYAWHEAIDPLLKMGDDGRFASELGETMAGLVDEFAQTWVKNQKQASKDAANKDGARHMMAILAGRARQGLRRAAEHGEDPQPWIERANLLREAERQLYSNVNLKMLLENLAVQWPRAGRSLSHA